MGVTQCAFVDVTTYRIGQKLGLVIICEESRGDYVQ